MSAEPMAEALLRVATRSYSEAEQVNSRLGAVQHYLDIWLDELDGIFTDRKDGEVWPPKAEKLRNMLVMLNADIRDVRTTCEGVATRADALIDYLREQEAATDANV